MSYLRYLCLFAYSGVQHILCCVICFGCLLLVSCVPNFVNFSRLFILDCPFGFSNVYLPVKSKISVHRSVRPSTSF